MSEKTKPVLTGLRESLAAKAEKAYAERDAAEAPSARSFAAGACHAYSVAEHEVRKAEKVGRIGQ